MKFFQVANYFINKDPLRGVTPLRLQRLMYFSLHWYYRITKEKLFDETPYVTSHGPLFKEIEEKYGNYNKKTKEDEELLKDGYPFYGHAIIDYELSKNLTEKERKVLDGVWKVYSKKTYEEMFWSLFHLDSSFINARESNLEKISFDFIKENINKILAEESQ